MRKFSVALLVLCLPACVSRPAWAGERETALAVLEHAIKAHGGADALAKARIAMRTGAGTMAAPGKEVPFTDEMAWELPGHFRLTVDLGTGGNKTRLILVVTPEKGWQNSGGTTVELGRDRLEELREEVYVMWLTTLTPLTKDTAFELAPLGEKRLSGQAVVGVKVKHKGHEDARLWFDKQTGLLLEIERRAREAGGNVEKEYFYGVHKEFDGVKLPTREEERINGKKFSELTSITYRFPRSGNEAAFSKP